MAILKAEPSPVLLLGVASTRRQRIRFSLRTAIVIMFLVASSGGLWLRHAAWALVWTAPVSSNHFRMRSISPNQRLLAAYTSEMIGNEKDFKASIQVLDAKWGEMRWSFSAKRANCSLFAQFSPDSQWLLISCFGQGNAYERVVFHASDGVRANIEGESWYSALAEFSPDGKWMLAQINGEICAIELPCIQKRTVLKGMIPNVCLAKWAQNGRSIVTSQRADGDYMVSIWDFDTGALKGTCSVGEGLGQIASMFVPHPETLVVGTESFQNLDADRVSIIDLKSNCVVREVYGRLVSALPCGKDTLLCVRRWVGTRLLGTNETLMLEYAPDGNVIERAHLKPSVPNLELQQTDDEYIDIDPRRKPSRWFDLRTGRIAARPGVRSPDNSRYATLRGKRLNILDEKGSEIFHADLPVSDLKTTSIEPLFCSNERVLTQYDHTWMGLWERRRPEYWWGFVYLPEFWLMLLFAGALAWSVRGDSRQISARHPH
jgi:hypothetical protein